jgi:hypothetical protein
MAPFLAAIGTRYGFRLAALQGQQQRDPSRIVEHKEVEQDIGIENEAIRYHCEKFFRGKSMLIVLSPAKSLDYESPINTREHTLPEFIDHSAELVDGLRQLSPSDIASLMKI